MEGTLRDFDTDTGINYPQQRRTKQQKCPIPYALAQCPIPYALGPMPYALGPMPYALGPMPVQDLSVINRT